jgi:hypothetical protein
MTKTLLVVTAVTLALSPGIAEAKGCIKGAIVGGIAGHLAGHGKAGAVAGCAIGHHEANKPPSNGGHASPAAAQPNRG